MWNFRLTWSARKEAAFSYLQPRENPLNIVCLQDPACNATCATATKTRSAPTPSSTTTSPERSSPSLATTLSSSAPMMASSTSAGRSTRTVSCQNVLEKGLYRRNLMQNLFLFLSQQKCDKGQWKKTHLKMSHTLTACASQRNGWVGIVEKYEV